MQLFNNSFDMLKKSLDYSSAKNQAIAHNIANIDTPHYKAKDVVFKDVLNNVSATSIQARRTHPKHIPFAKETHLPYQVITRSNTVYNHNGNNVDVDKEMSALAQNQIYYQALIDRLNGKFRNIQTVVRGGN